MRSFWGRFYLLSWFCGMLFLSPPVVAAFEVPALKGPVMDLAQVMSETEQRRLSQLLMDLRDEGVVQMQVLLVPSLEGLPIEQASIQIFDQWKLGDEKKQNGVLFLASLQDRKMRLEIGRGLEGAIPDAVAKRIVSDIMAPRFREARYGAGIVAGLDVVSRLAKGEAVEQGWSAEKRETHDFVVFLVLALVFFLIGLGRMTGHLPGGGRRLRRGAYGGFPVGGGWGGGGFGGGGGGWSGGGGGSAGGGASGGW